MRQAITADDEAVQEAIAVLQSNGGGDDAEAYGRALFEADLDPAVGWRPGVRRFIVLIADDLPHDDDVNEGISDEDRDQALNPNTGADPGRDGVLGTADDIDWQPLLKTLADHGIPLMYVHFNGRPEYLPYWKAWAAVTGGAADDSSNEGLADSIVDLIHTGTQTPLPPCPPDEVRDPDGRCAEEPAETARADEAPSAVESPAAAGPPPDPQEEATATGVASQIRAAYAAAREEDGGEEDRDKEGSREGRVRSPARPGEARLRRREEIDNRALRRLVSTSS